MVGKGAKLQESITVTPNGEEFTVNPSDGFDAVKQVVVAGDDNLDPYNIREGVVIYGVRGELEETEEKEANLGSKTITENGVYLASDDNLDGFSIVSVDVPAQEAKLIGRRVDATDVLQVIYPPEGYDGFNLITVGAVKYKLVRKQLDLNLVPSNIQVPTT